MNLPGFRAEAAVQPQLLGEPRIPSLRGLPSSWTDALADVPVGSGAHLPANPSWCDWQHFCCLEFHDRACCSRWRLQCVPQ